MVLIRFYHQQEFWIAVNIIDTSNLIENKVYTNEYIMYMHRFWRVYSTSITHILQHIYQTILGQIKYMHVSDYMY